ncbi:5-formyltetrahydrofolate cyclo-ligase [Ekhidna sp. To15]|uniref:5-formyltetrahydrofolate cyclo-ligase n=1 Tax=Ekhidna sp. To15 TaxID=3395267 RepID=UPI003F51D6EF
MITKSYFRKVILHYRILADGLMYTQRNEQLCEAITSFLKGKDFQKIHTFLAIKENNEPDISPLFEKLWQDGKQVIVSKTDFMFKQMRHYLLEEHTQLELNKKGIPEPVGAVEIALDDLDIIFVPLLLSDKQGFRIGYGGGYYDRLLAETNSLKVGLSLSPPVDEILQKEDWDIPLDYLITPFKTYQYG